MSRTLNKELHNWWKSTGLVQKVPAERVSAVGVVANETEEKDDNQDEFRDTEVSIGTAVTQGQRTNEETIWQAEVVVTVYGPDPDHVEDVGDAVSDEWFEDDTDWVNIVRFEMKFEAK